MRLEPIDSYFIHRKRPDAKNEVRYDQLVIAHCDILDRKYLLSRVIYSPPERHLKKTVPHWSRHPLRKTYRKSLCLNLKSNQSQIATRSKFIIFLALFIPPTSTRHVLPNGTKGQTWSDVSCLLIRGALYRYPIFNKRALKLISVS